MPHEEGCFSPTVGQSGNCYSAGWGNFAGRGPGRKGGDGLLGFAQAFLAAGSRSVCLSLWTVDDTATALLMDRFYRNLLGFSRDTVQAGSSLLSAICSGTFNPRIRATREPSSGKDRLEGP
jgi:hypothetical protein